MFLSRKAPAWLCLFAALIMSSCSNRYAQVFHTRPISTDVYVEDEQYHFKNEDIEIVYDFWSQGGELSFTIHNRGKNPVYIDWFKSSFMFNGKSLRYYDDAEINVYAGSSRSRGAAYGASRNYGRESEAAAVSASRTISSGASTTIRSERVTFIPPGGYITNRRHYIFRGWLMAYKNNWKEYVVENRSVYEFKPSNPEADLAFQNFITYSSRDDFREEVYVKNMFTLDRVKFMPWAAFIKGPTPYKSRVYDSPYKDHTDFFVEGMTKKSKIMVSQKKGATE